MLENRRDVTQNLFIYCQPDERFQLKIDDLEAILHNAESHINTKLEG